MTAHHAYIWLHGLKDAIEQLQHTNLTNHTTTHTLISGHYVHLPSTFFTWLSSNLMTADIRKELGTIQPDTPLPPPLYGGNITTSVNCYTDYEPRSDPPYPAPSYALSSLVLGGARQEDKNTTADGVNICNYSTRGEAT